MNMHRLFHANKEIAKADIMFGVMGIILVGRVESK